MNMTFNKIKTLQDVSISGYNLDAFKGDLDDIRGRLKVCSDQLAAMVPAVAAPGLPPT